MEELAGHVSPPVKNRHPALKMHFEGMRLGEVETFIASGNVILSSAGDAGRLETFIEHRAGHAHGHLRGRRE
ncbi:MAG: DUF1697 domain-containing protein [Solirubrobacterales bacterium]